MTLPSGFRRGRERENTSQAQRLEKAADSNVL